MLKIFAARHGQNVDNANGILNGHRDLPLTKLGIQQAKELAQGMLDTGLSFDAVYVSPLGRAFSTAEIVCGALGLPPPQILHGLKERDFGIMTGKPAADIEKLCPGDFIKTDTITYFLSPPGAETFPVLLERAHATLKEVEDRHSHGSILLVTHGDIGKMLYVAYYGLPWQDVLTIFHFGNSELLLLSPDSEPTDSHVVRITQHNH